MKSVSLLAFLMLAGCSSSDPATAGKPDGGSATGPGGADTDSGSPADGGNPDASAPNPTFGEGTNPCTSLDNTPGNVVDLPWPNPNNTGHFATEGDTIHFHWDDQSPHNVVQVAAFDVPYSDPKFTNELRSGDKTVKGTFDWNTGVSPCGYRPGIYFFIDENNPNGGIVSIALTTKDNPSPEFAKKPCSALTDPNNYRGRYAQLATRADCTQFEVNNFTTQAHFDWVLPTFGATQGDLLVFRWSGLHNVVQVHDAAKDVLIPGGILSGPRTNCVAGPNYSCINGAYSLGETLIDTTNHRPGMIHLSDGCAYGCASCPWDCQGPDHNATGTGMEFLLARPRTEPAHVDGECCALDKSKGTKCRVVDLYNDYEGLQFDYNVPVNRGDLVRMRWGGTIKIVQTTPNADGSPSQNPKPNGAAMPASIECIPGPNWSCLGASADASQFVFDVDKAVTAGNVETTNGNQFFDFYAFGENTDGASSANSGILLYIGQKDAYTENPACP